MRGLVFATAALSTGVGVHAALHRSEPGATWVGVGAVGYVAALMVTGSFNVPRNNRLASFDAMTPEAARYWST